MTELSPWIAPILFFATVIGWAMKYGSDKTKIVARIEAVEKMEKLIENDRAYNLKQHEEFYKNRDMTNELKADMRHIMASIDEIKKMLERRAEPR
jgi:hypothetical protein